MKWDALIASYLAILYRLDGDSYTAVVDEIARLRELQAAEAREAA